MAETKPGRVEDTKSNDANDQNTKNQINKMPNNPSNTAGGDAKNTSDKSSIDAKEIYEQAKDTAGQAYDKVTEQASSQIDAQKENLARGLSSVADGIRQMGENLRGDDKQTPIANLTAKYSNSLARQVEQVSSYLENKDLSELIKDVERFARRNPAAFIGGAFALGIAAARFLKSNNPNQSLMRRSNNRRGVYIPDKEEGVYLPEDLSRKVGLTDSTFSKTTAKDSNPTGASSSDSSARAGTNAASSTESTNRTSSTDFSSKQGG